MIEDKEKISKKVLVIGGGIAGMTSAIELARAGLEVNLVEKEHSLGGFGIRYCCKASVSCNKCSACLVNLKMNEFEIEDKINVLTDCEVFESSEIDGKFKVKIKKSPRYVSIEKCIACGKCKEVCPVKGSAIKLPHPQAYPKTYFIDKTLCLRFKGENCKLCKGVCPTGAVDYEEKEKDFAVDSDCVVVACGFSPFDARERSQYRYGVFQNVITALDLEEQLRFNGELRKPSDNLVPQRIAFIQCVGSRDIKLGNDYCSQVCCLYALRMARLLKNEDKDRTITIFFMDLQNIAKEAGSFYEACSKEINLMRAMPGNLEEDENKAVVINYEDIEEGKNKSAEFDLVVLSIGIKAGENIDKVSKVFGLKREDNGFFKSCDPYDLTLTEKQNIFIAGACQGPKDISSSIAQGLAAAENVVKNLDSGYKSRLNPKEVKNPKFEILNKFK